MKKLIFALVVLAAVVAAFVYGAAAALADNGPHAGSGFGSTPDQCAACHRAHTGKLPKLLGAAVANQAAFCWTCHDGTGADTNVKDGISVSSTLGLRGGGFINALMDPGLTGIPASAATSSTHIVDGTSATAWGGGAISATADYGTAITLECANCHNPHGNGQYRILRRTPNEGYGTTDVTVDDETTKDYDISYMVSNYRDTSYAPANLEDWCAQCHTRYLAGADSGDTDSGDAVFKYRHMTDGLTGGCIKCHVAHGTTASMGSYSGAVTLPDGTAGGGAGDSRLLHVNNRGVCFQCHASGLTDD